MREKPSVREIWQGKDKDRRYYAVERNSTEDADEHMATVVREGDMIRCLRCDRSESLEFKCQHLEAIKDHLDPR